LKTALQWFRIIWN